MSNSLVKICVICGENVAGKPRTKDTAGNYYCQPCYDQAATRRQEEPNDVVEQNDALADLTASTSVESTPKIDQSPFSCPSCGRLFPFHLMHASGVCKRCAADGVKRPRAVTRGAKSSTKKLLLIGGVALVIVAAATAGFVLLSGPKGSSSITSADASPPSYAAGVLDDVEGRLSKQNDAMQAVANQLEPGVAALENLKAGLETGMKHDDYVSQLGPVRAAVGRMSSVISPTPEASSAVSQVVDQCNHAVKTYMQAIGSWDNQIEANRLDAGYIAQQSEQGMQELWSMAGGDVRSARSFLDDLKRPAVQLVVPIAGGQSGHVTGLPIIDPSDNTITLNGKKFTNHLTAADLESIYGKPTKLDVDKDTVDLDYGDFTAIARHNWVIETLMVMQPQSVQLVGFSSDDIVNARFNGPLADATVEPVSNPILPEKHTKGRYEWYMEQGKLSSFAVEFGKYYEPLGKRH